jgi:vacuolar-type H+-ATPase subunit D/Vma8
MNLKAFSKTIEMEIRMNQKDQDISSLKEEIENLKKTVNNPSG